MPGDDVRAILGRRPPRGEPAFGHVDLSEKARAQLADIVRGVKERCEGSEEVPFHPTDRPEDGEVLAGSLHGFDSHYQEKAPWSLERTVASVRASGVPEPLGAKEIEGGRWSFYALRLAEAGTDTVVIRRRAPTYGLTNKWYAVLAGTELRPVEEPLLSFDYDAEVAVVDQRVYVLRPEQTERLFVDADEVKRRAPETVGRFAKDIGARLSADTVMAVERVCSRNAFTARRVERLLAEGVLREVNAAEVREGLHDAGLAADAFGSSGPLAAESDDLATKLVEIADDLYYQPRFARPSRRVAGWRNVG
ncbi:MAG TPA: hypothetical protein VHA76_07275 [Solirubrobacterales bacterium]|nr:hypothetical protein [Solirubrobacterales bacterium]